MRFFQAVLGWKSECRVPAELLQAREYLAVGQTTRAWNVIEGLRAPLEAMPEDSPGSGQQLDVLATHGVAAAATGRLEMALQDFLHAKKCAASAGNHDRELFFASLVDRAEALLDMAHGVRDPIAGPYWKSRPLPALDLPQAWAPWMAALPAGSEFVGPVEVRRLPGVHARERGLFATREIRAGEVLMVAKPLVAAQDLERLGAAVVDAFESSLRMRWCLTALAGSSTAEAMPPENAQRALSPMPDELPPSSRESMKMEELGEAAELSQSANGDSRWEILSKLPELQELQTTISRNAMRMADRFLLFGLPSMLNHACNGHGANVVKLPLDHLGGMVAFMAARGIEANEELRHSYAAVDSSRRDRCSQGYQGPFTCSCSRCAFEALQMSGSSAAAAADSAVELFVGTLRTEMRALAATPETPEAASAAARKLWGMLGQLLSALQRVEDAVEREHNWHMQERGWCWVLVQPLLNAAIWCIFKCAPLAKQAGGIEGFDPDAMLSLRCRILRHLVFTWQHTRFMSTDHLRNVYMLWSARDEARVRGVARLAAVSSVGMPESSGRRMQGTTFQEGIRQPGGLRELLEASGGLIHVSNLLPDDKAKEALAVLEGFDSKEWVLSENISRDDADHRFWRYAGRGVDWLRSEFAAMAPSMHPHFNAAKYDGGGRITLHNDAKTWEVDVASQAFPEGMEVQRKIAIIYYLTPEWKEAYGGALVDNLVDGPQRILPEFNSMVSFLVPREHWVTQVAEDAPKRYSIFGWFSDAEPYPEGCPKPLGSGNTWSVDGAGPGAVEEDRVQGAAGAEALAATWRGCDSEPACAPRQGAPQGSFCLRDPMTAREAVVLAADARKQCEEAFQLRFGIKPEELRLGERGSPAMKLMDKLKSTE